MPRVTMEKVDLERGRQAWKLGVKWDEDVQLTVYGETVSGALRNLAQQVKDQEDEGWKREREAEGG